MHADIAMLLLRLCFTAPVLLIGLLLSVDPGSFVQISENFAGALQAFKYRLTGVAAGQSFAFSASPGTLLSMRLVGVALSAVAVVAVLVPWVLK